MFVPPTIIQIFNFQYTHTLGLLHEIPPTILCVCTSIQQYSGSARISHNTQGLYLSQCCGYNVSPKLYTLVLKLPQYCESVSPVILWIWISLNTVGPVGLHLPQCCGYVCILWVWTSHNTVSLYLPQYSGSVNSMLFTFEVYNNLIFFYQLFLFLPLICRFYIYWKCLLMKK